MDDKKRRKIVDMVLTSFQDEEYPLLREHLITEVIFLTDSAVEMYSSLLKAVDDAGGVGYSVKELKNMSVLELISRLCTNNIRFIYKREIDEENKKER